MHSPMYLSRDLAQSPMSFEHHDDEVAVRIQTK
jgi:hypothetical protein